MISYCHDCLCKEGELHNYFPGCDMERCPLCKGQLLSCGCDKSMDTFNSLKEGIALLNINGRVEGHNFKDEDDEPVKNIIVYGYPFPRPDLLFKDELMYLTNILGDKQKAEKWMWYVPVLDRIHQACMRAKRDEKDKPIIILWDNQFGKGERGYKYMPDDLKGELIYEPEQLINLVKRKNGQR